MRSTSHVRVPLTWATLLVLLLPVAACTGTGTGTGSGTSGPPPELDRGSPSRGSGSY